MKEDKIAKILIFLILLTLLSSRIFAQQNQKIRVCISQLNSKQEASSLIGDEEKKLSFKGPHYFYNEQGVLLEVKEAQDYTVRNLTSQMPYYMDLSGVSTQSPDFFKGVALFVEDEPRFAISEEVKISSSESSFTYDGREYAQDIYFIKAKEGFIPINYIDAEEYLRGVVPVEMPHTWHIEALKSQAIASRTYAYRCIQENADKFTDILSTTADQAYQGMRAYKKESDIAIEQTANEILYYEKIPIFAFYSSDNGGYTVGDLNYPYLKAKKDSYSEDSVQGKWEHFLKLESLEKIFSLDKVKGIQIRNTDDSHRVQEIVIQTLSQEKKVTGKEFRKALGYSNIKSTFFSIFANKKDSDENIVSSSPIESHSKSSNSYFVLSMHGIKQMELDYKYIENAVTKRKLQKNEKCYLQSGSGIENNAESKLQSQKIQHLESRGNSGIEQYEDGVYIKGSGYGHGLGMSQWGAKKRAESGQDYKQILAFYYEGAIIENK